MKRNIPWFIIIALIAALALSACKEDENEPQRILTITGLEDYNTFEAKITLVQLTTTKAKGATTVSGNQATFALVDNDGNPFTEGGLAPYSATLTIAGASGTDVGAYGGVLAAVWLTQEKTSVKLTEFTGKGTDDIDL
jgi:hypothetical protein